MAGSTLASVKRAWVDALGSLDALAGWDICYDFPGPDNLGRSAVALGDARVSVEVPVMRAGRRRREESIDLDLHIWCVVDEIGGTGIDPAEAADIEAIGALQAIDEHIADGLLMAAPDEVWECWLDGWTREGMLSAAGGRITHLTVTVRWKARQL
jgi:hypothetical protein